MIREQIYRNEDHRTLKFVSKIMGFIFLLWFAITFLARVRGLDERLSGSNFNPQLEILPDTGSFENTLHKRVSDSLILTCRINWRPNTIKPRPRFSVSWIPPPPPLNEKKGKSEVQMLPNNYNSMTLNISHLRESDEGEYKCEAREITKGIGGDILEASIRVIVLQNCSQKMFECPSKSASPSHCIFKRFVCDGKQDCADGEDESVLLANCDPEPCKDKLTCDDGRCIPFSWCCSSDSKSDCNVTHPYKDCCRKLNASSYSSDIHPNLKGMVDDQASASLNHMGFLQTTIFTVIGCAMAFMVIVTILVIAIDRKSVV